MKFLSAYILILFSVVFTSFGQDSLFSSGVAVAQVPNPAWNEISGLVASRKYPNRLYMHNDSGGENAVYLMSVEGAELGKITLEGVQNRDWEDIAFGPGPKGQDYIYVAEIGDNLAQHEEIRIYRFPEPDSDNSTLKPEVANYVYPNGPMDAEAIFLDPISEKLYLISKRDSANTLFEMPLRAFDTKKVETLVELIKLPFSSTVAADIRFDGQAILIKNYFSIYHWDRNPEESIEVTLAKPYRQLPYTPEPQGESVAFQADGEGYFTLSEERFGIKPVLYHYKKTH
ncbi:hypothetical protein [Algoriphagus namhaensis]